MAASARPRRPGGASSAARADAVGVNSAAASAATTLATISRANDGAKAARAFATVNPVSAATSRPLRGRRLNATDSTGAATA